MKKQLLLLHGAIGSKEQLQPLAKQLEGNFAVHTINFSGHGGEEIPDKFSIETFADDVLLYLEKNRIEKINIFGYSMGDYVALYLAKFYPQRVESVFTLATKFLWTPEIAEKEIKMLDAGKIKEKIPSFAAVLEKRHTPQSWRTILERTAQMMKEMGDHNPLAPSDYKDIAHKTLIAIGDKDTMVTLEETIDVYRHLKNAGLLVMPDNQHPIEKVDFSRLKNEILQFFK